MNRAAIFFLVFITLGLAILLALLGAATIRSNLLGWFLLVLGSTYFFGVIIVYWIRRIQFWRPRAKGEFVKEEQNDWSFWLIVIGMISVFYLPPLEYIFLPAALPCMVWMQATGLTFIILGSVLFIWARRMLGKFYSGHVSVIEGQLLMQSGPYRFIRHPAYAGYLLMSLGLALGYSSLAGLAATLFLLLPSVIYRIRIEDKMLAEYFGNEFKAYAARVARLIPGLW
ncbi:isoprenylcysteine carboxylmethyltransferase family protein [Candidatus Villigracilis saccharophilus]|uniref:methyltransferase family protein n=1 Tax=Candidatus Villigracilis saccharophilus TaxID=3140684 RepID=UPI00313556EA|nr:isoprenylcysteine carboxylmethyltransferase family protein [Anaerolineales bacterium]